jgi:hypothetical protein
MQPVQRVALLTFGLVVLYFVASHARGRSSSAPAAGNPIEQHGGVEDGAGKPVYRKRLVAIGDLHGGVSSPPLPMTAASRAIRVVC